MTFGIRVIDLGGRAVPAVDWARLHRAIRGAAPDRDWLLAGRIAEHGYEEGVDYAVLGESRLLSLDMARELCLLEGTSEARRVRRLLFEAGRGAEERRRAWERRRLIKMVEALEARLRRLERAVAGFGDDLGEA